MLMHAGILSAIATLGLLAWVWTRAPTPGRCRRCLYPLTGLREPRCPECGSPVNHPSHYTTDARRTLLICLAIAIAWSGTAIMLIVGGQSHLARWIARIDSMPVVSINTAQSLRPSVAGMGRARAGQPLYAVQLSFVGRLNGLSGVVSGLSSATLRYGDHVSVLKHRIGSDRLTISSEPDRSGRAAVSSAASTPTASALETSRPFHLITPQFLRDELERLGAVMPKGNVDHEAAQELELLAGVLQDFLARPTTRFVARHPLNPVIAFNGDVQEPFFVSYATAPEFEAAQQTANVGLSLLAVCVLVALCVGTWRILRPARSRAARRVRAMYIQQPEAGA